MVKKLRCPFCGGTWTPRRTLKPKACVRCKRYFDYNKEGHYPEVVELPDLPKPAAVVKKVIALPDIVTVTCAECGAEVQKYVLVEGREVCINCLLKMIDEKRPQTARKAEVLHT